MSEVRSPGRSRWLLGLVVLGLAFVGFTQWQIAASDLDAEALSDFASVEEPAEAEAEAEIEISDATNALAADEEALDDGVDSGNGSEESVDAGVAVEDQRRVGGPIVGEETGLGIIMGRATSQELLLLDLDSGEEHELAARGELIGILGKSLVLRSGPEVRLVGMDSPANEGLVLPTDSNGYVDVIAIGEELVWVIGIEGQLNPEDSVVTAFDESGEQVAEATFDRFMAFPGWGIDSNLVQTSGGGIYRREDGGFRRLSTGTLVAVGERLALALECDDQMTCRHNWYDKNDWGDPLDLPEPQFSGEGSASVQAGDRWLVETNWEVQQTVLIEIATGESVRDLPRQGPPLNPAQHVPLSPDGRWLLEPRASGVLVVDLDTTTEWPYESDAVSWGISGLFIDLESVDFVP